MNSTTRAVTALLLLQVCAFCVVCVAASEDHETYCVYTYDGPDCAGKIQSHYSFGYCKIGDEIADVGIAPGPKGDCIATGADSEWSTAYARMGQKDGKLHMADFSFGWSDCGDTMRGGQGTEFFFTAADVTADKSACIPSASGGGYSAIIQKEKNGECALDTSADGCEAPAGHTPATETPSTPTAEAPTQAPAPTEAPAPTPPLQQADYADPAADDETSGASGRLSTAVLLIAGVAMALWH